MKLKTEGLRRALGFWDSVAINVGIVIGVGIFRTPGAIAHYIPSAPLILLTWVAGGLVALLGVLCYAELSSCFPQTGGTYVYIREAYGRPLGFLFGWIEFAILRAGSIAAVAYIFTDYLGNVVPAVAGSERLFAIAAIAFFTGLNIAGLRVGAGVQSVLSLLKALAIVLISALVFSKRGLPTAHADFGPFRAAGFAGMLPALIPVIWTYGGWHESTFVSGEFRDTRRELPLSLIASSLLIMALYLLINTAYLQVMTPAEMAGQKAIASEVLKRLFGPAGGMIVTAAVLISAGGALNSTILTGGRIPYAVAQDHPRLEWMGRVHERFQTPYLSLVLNASWASVLVLWGTFDKLLFFSAFAYWLFFALAGAGVFILRRRGPRSLEGSFLMLGYPVVPFLFIVSAVVICLITVFHAPKESLFGALLLLAGLPVYRAFGK